MFFYSNYLRTCQVWKILLFRTTRLFLSGMVSHNVACINWAFKNRVERGYLMFVGEAYRKWVYLLNSKCFIIAVCMVLCGNICSSGFYSDDFHVRGCEVAQKKGLLQTNSLTQSVRRSVAQTLNSSFFYFQIKKTERITTGPLCCYLLYLQSRSLELCNIYRGILSLGVNGP